MGNLNSKLVKSFDSGSSGTQMHHRRYKSSGSSNISSSSNEKKQPSKLNAYATHDLRVNECLQNTYFNYQRRYLDEKNTMGVMQYGGSSGGNGSGGGIIGTCQQPSAIESQSIEKSFYNMDAKLESIQRKLGHFQTFDDQQKGLTNIGKGPQNDQQWLLKSQIQQKITENPYSQQMKQGFLERAPIFNMKMKQIVDQDSIALGIKSITTPNSPRRSISKNHNQQNASNGSQVENLENVNNEIITLKEDKSGMNTKHKIILPKGIIHFHGSQTRANSGGSKSAERKARKINHSHEPREESLRRKVKVMEIIKNFENDKEQQSKDAKTQIIQQQQELKDISFLLKSRKYQKQEAFQNNLFDKGKVLLHNKITRTFVVNTPEQSCEKVPAIQEPVRQRDKKPQTRQQSPLMNDLNSYMFQKDYMQMPKIQGGTLHSIGINVPPNDIYQKLKASKSREKAPNKNFKMNSNQQLLFNLQSHNFKQSGIFQGKYANRGSGGGGADFEQQ